MKTISKILLVALTLTLAISVCGCGYVKAVVRDTPRAVVFVNEISEVTQIKDPDVAAEEGKKLLHPKSNLDTGNILNLILEDEAVKSLDLESVSMDKIVIGEFSDPKFNINDKTLDGNVYDVNVTVTVDGHPFIVTLHILSDDSGMGIYSFDITQ